MDHPFYDGNKRIAAKALDVDLQANGIILLAINDEMKMDFYHWPPDASLAKISYHGFVITSNKHSLI